MSNAYEVRVTADNESLSIAVSCTVCGKKYGASAMRARRQSLDLLLLELVDILLSVIPYRAIDVVKFTVGLYSEVRKRV